MNIDPDVLATTRRSLHAVGEHVLVAALFPGRNRIGLRQFTGGFATQNDLHVRDGAAVERRAMVVGTEIIVRDDDLKGGTIEDRARSPRGFWNEPFGASLSLEEVPTVDEVLTFFGEGHRQAQGE